MPSYAARWMYNIAFLVYFMCKCVCVFRDYILQIKHDYILIGWLSDWFFCGQNCVAKNKFYFILFIIASTHNDVISNGTTEQHERTEFAKRLMCQHRPIYDG